MAEINCSIDLHVMTERAYQKLVAKAKTNEGIVKDYHNALAAHQKILRQLAEAWKWSKHWRDSYNAERRHVYTRRDTERLDWLQDNTRGYGDGWVLRDSDLGRGLRLHETSRGDETSRGEATPRTSVRQAIDSGMERL